MGAYVDSNSFFFVSPALKDYLLPTSLAAAMTTLAISLQALAWVLLCSLPTEDVAAMRLRRDWYACRWMIEV
jgi:hypothetical protein